MDVNQKILLVVLKFDRILINLKIILFLFSMVIVGIHRNIVIEIMDVYQPVGIIQIQLNCFIIVLLFGNRFIFFFLKKN